MTSSIFFTEIPKISGGGRSREGGLSRHSFYTIHAPIYWIGRNTRPKCLVYLPYTTQHYTMLTSTCTVSRIKGFSARVYVLFFKEIVARDLGLLMWVAYLKYCKNGTLVLSNFFYLPTTLLKTFNRFVCMWLMTLYCKALCDVKISQVEGNGPNGHMEELRNSVISVIIYSWNYRLFSVLTHSSFSTDFFLYFREGLKNGF